MSGHSATAWAGVDTAGPVGDSCRVVPACGPGLGPGYWGRWAPRGVWGGGGLKARMVWARSLGAEGQWRGSGLAPRRPRQREGLRLT